MCLIGMVLQRLRDDYPEYQSMIFNKELLQSILLIGLTLISYSYLTGGLNQ
ncbi:hypothetical protein N9R25_02375 [Gammaproteobacteria bacterium]|nr:hypothetical protein [Gammaproteobacteria bacterium]